MNIKDLFNKKKIAYINQPPEINSNHKITYSMSWLIDQGNIHGLEINSDGSKVLQVLSALSNTDGHCPCIPKYIRSDDTICPCNIVRTHGICDCGLFKESRLVPKSTQTAASIKVKQSNMEKHPELYMAVTPVHSGDTQTLVIQCNRADVSIVTSIVRSHKRKNATSHIDAWRNVDIFVNINNQPGFRWLRVVYEVLDENPNPGSKFSDGYIIRVERTFNKPAMTLDMILNGDGRMMIDG